MFITVCYIYKRKQLKWTPAAAGGTELIYADISLEEKGEKKNTEVPPYVDVEYAMVKLQTKRKEEEEVEEEGEVEENEENKEEVEKKEEKEEEEYEVVEEKEQEEVEEEEEDVKEKEEEEKEVGEELQYGEVTFTPNHSHNPQELQNQCVF
ncbi:X-linked retinitis pigmentosa GTPase regulator-interacting protein 1-like [Carassius gibelio]|uniref:X-linked retinitis pigmentosa GTPase regulator-interacting protein 1-like n=1 Tax=Carassius gibelio TaxID=101364 RepID=UPI002278AF03|nr:X-linked retinitis pigmentosa GTPase regulator-interacting protein 1-like [Carassius gibelio]